MHYLIRTGPDQYIYTSMSHQGLLYVVNLEIWQIASLRTSGTIITYSRDVALNIIREIRARKVPGFHSSKKYFIENAELIDSKSI